MGFIGEFKKFINRGNIVDMAVGVIVGSSFTAVVNGLSNYVLKPLINALLYYLMDEDSVDQVHTIIVPAYKADESGAQVLDLDSSIYIDWGSFIHAIINFFLVAAVLFLIVKTINKVRESHRKALENILDDFPTREERREMRKLKLDYRDREVLERYRAEKEAAEKAKAEEKARRDRLEHPTTEQLLKEILAVMKAEREESK